ncbi:Snf7-domain-containing protein [Aspergillus japonicus CBS 114.51]|uniref:Snf7-domain-containing protein n=2 Tax=Aspergillus TaxID=5052 RepID=A0A2V5H3Z6_ASPV1|nr:Snf7-domain-containing protein [Aspergillus japonicus CBS 114.51]PYI18748.1 Snf7-domain-containing protein [Aspergillus violaceofuscus CBS 115571]RAH82068.1 Snf7-domain-containing protein [Aspergillus japonicus CBS 114.51]
MGNANSSHKISAQDRAILDLKNQRDKLRQYQKRITVLTDRETAIAKECLARDDRKRALLALRRKKYQESLLEKTDKQLEQLEQLTGQIEFALVQKDVLFGLQQGTQVLQTIHREMGGIEGVEKLMGETEEARAYQEEISQMLAGRLSREDEDEVEEELEELQRQAQGPVVLPNAPVSSLPEVGEEETEAEAGEAQAESLSSGRKVKAEERTAVLA